MSFTREIRGVYYEEARLIGLANSIELKVMRWLPVYPAKSLFTCAEHATQSGAGHVQSCGLKSSESAIFSQIL